jgi:hypothetical protein
MRQSTLSPKMCNVAIDFIVKTLNIAVQRLEPLGCKSSAMLVRPGFALRFLAWQRRRTVVGKEADHKAATNLKYIDSVACTSSP